MLDKSIINNIIDMKDKFPGHWYLFFYRQIYKMSDCFIDGRDLTLSFDWYFITLV